MIKTILRERRFLDNIETEEVGEKGRVNMERITASRKKVVPSGICNLGLPMLLGRYSPKQ